MPNTQTVEDVCAYTRSVVASASDLSIPLLLNFYNRRYTELAARTHMRHLRRYGELNYPTPVTAGTVVATQGSNQVVGTGTGWTSGIIGWFFRLATNWYQINDIITQTQTLVLNSPFNENPSSFQTYTILQRYLPLAKNARWVGQIVHPRLFRRLAAKTLNWLDAKEPSRSVIAAFPTVWAEGPSYKGDYPGTDDRRKTVEIYPPSPQAEFFPYVYWEYPEKPELGDSLPPEIDGYMVAEGMKIDIYEYRAQQALQGSTPDVARAELFMKYQTLQMAVWEKKLQQAVTADMISADEDVELWSDYEDCTVSDINPEYDNWVSRMGIVTVQ